MMKWYVWKEDFNSKKLEKINVFSHSRFLEDVETAFAHYNGKAFSEEVRHIAQYYFWGKCEYEFLIYSWPREDHCTKVSIYDQLELNWDIFIKYIQENICLES